MIHFEVGEPVNVPNCIVMVGGDFEDMAPVSICKWETQDVEYCQVPAYFLKYGSWK